jgi:hypothetical protein
MKVKYILHLEGLFVFLASLYFYGALNGNWLWLVLLLFTPDISMLGYLRDTKIGAFGYNLIHNYILSLIIIVAAYIFDYQFVLLGGLILSAHVGLDRFLGYGLKYATRFQDTHLQRV